MKNIPQLQAQNARLEAAKEARVTDDELTVLGMIGPQGGRRHSPTPGTPLDVACKRLLERGWVYVATGIVFDRGNPTYKPTPEGLKECEKRLPQIRALETARYLAEAKRVKAAHDADPIKDGYGYHRQTYGVAIKIGGRIQLTDFPFAGRKATILPPERCAYHLESITVQLDSIGLLVGVHPLNMTILEDSDIAPEVVEREPTKPLREEFAKILAEAPV